MKGRGKVLKDGRYKITCLGQEIFLEPHQYTVSPDNRIGVSPVVMDRLREMADQVLSCCWESAQKHRR